MDFLLGGHLKELVYLDLFTTESDLVARLHAVNIFVKSTLLQRAQLPIPRLSMRGGHFERLHACEHMQITLLLFPIKFYFVHRL